LRVLYSSPYVFAPSTANDTPPWIKPTPIDCRWIFHPDCQVGPFVTAYRNVIHLDEDRKVTVHVAADERYELYLDGKRVGRGNDRGDSTEWYFDTYAFTLSAGKHVLVARTWSLGHIAPWSQVTIRPGFMLAPEDPSNNCWLGTGVAKWEAARMDGYSFQDIGAFGIGTGARLKIDGHKFPWGFEHGNNCNWKLAGKGPYWNDGRTGFVSMGEHVLVPSILQTLLERPISGVKVRYMDSAERGELSEPTGPLHSPSNLDEEYLEWEGVTQGHSKIIPAHTSRRIIIDLQNYYCLYASLSTSGGAESVIRISFAEKLYNSVEGRGYGHRDEIEGKYFKGIGDEFICDGGDERKLDTLWWQAGRYIQVEIITKEEPLKLNWIMLEETRYPIESLGKLECEDESLMSILGKSLRTLQMCAHETFMDCPYWEQLMYAGDTRIESLIAYAITPDDALQRKAIRLFENSRMHPASLITCSAPSMNSKIIPSFIFWWVAMVYDFALYRKDRCFVRERMIVVRDMLDRLCSLRQHDGLLVSPSGWNYFDVPSSSSEWKYGIPGDDGYEANAPYNWLAVYTLRLATRLEAYLGEKELASRWMAIADRLQSNIDRIYWSEARGMYADTHALRSFSEHTQCLALLSGALNDSKFVRITKQLHECKELIRTSIFFTHYYFETCRVTKRTDKLYERLAEWKRLDEEGLMTTPEHWGSTRSDCHAWGAHPLFHYYTTILGIRPTEFEFERVAIEPLLGGNGHASGVMASPHGPIHASYQKSETGHFHACIELPATLAGQIVYGGHSRELYPGKQTLVFPPE
jgi:alpha-L-rhamnosidase